MFHERLKKYQRKFIVEKTGLSRATVWRVMSGKTTSEETERIISEFLRSEKV